METPNLKRLSILCAGLIALALTGLTACGGNDISCGQNTTNENGRCVLVEGQATTCGQGTRVSSTGRCVVENTSCGPGTAYSSEQEKCVPGSQACAEGTSFDPDSQSCIAATECGPNTTNQDGTCVVDTDALCANQPGVTFNSEAGRCEISSDSCGAGTTRSAESGTCVIADDSCSDGLAINDQGDCVATDELCNDNSTFKRIGGQPSCVPDVSCSQGDVVLQTDMDPSTPGLCVSPAEKLAANADAEDSEISNPMANNDPEGGTPDTLATKPVGQTAAYNGVIQPGDTQDVDAFSFMGTEGQWFNLSVQSTGLPQPWFRITGPNGYERQATYGLEGNPARTIAIPRDGEYTVSIQPTMARNERFDTVYGGSDWSYVAALEQVDPPQNPNTVDVSQNNLTGNLAGLTDNVTTLQGLSGAALARIEPISIGEDASAVLQLWNSTTDFHAGDLVLDPSQSDPARTLVLPSGGSNPLMIPDWVSADGPQLDYEISVTPITNSEDIGSVGADSTTMSSTQTVMSGNDFYFVFEAQQGQVIELTQTNNENAAVDITITDSIGNTIDSFSDIATPSERTNDEDYFDGYFPVTSTQTYVARVERSDSGGLTDLQLTVDSITPNDLGSISRGGSASASISQAISAGRSGLHTISLSESALSSGSVDVTMPASDADVALRMRPFSGGDNIVDAEATGSVGFADQILPADNILVQVGAPAPINAYDVSFEASEAIVESEPNDIQSNATSVDPGNIFLGQASNDVDWWSINLPQGTSAAETLLIRLYSSGSDEFNDHNCRLVDSSGTVVTEHTDRDIGCTLFANDLSSGTYYFRYNYTDSTNRLYTASANIMNGITETEPNDDTGEANAYPSGNLPSLFQGFFSDNGDGGGDYFQYTVPSSPPSNGELVVGADGLGPETDYFFIDLEVYDGSGSELADLDYDEPYFTTTSYSGGDTFYGNFSNTIPISSFDNTGYVGFEVFAPGQTISGGSGITIPEENSSGVTDTVTASNCATVDRVWVELDLDTNLRGAHRIELTSPSGNVARLETPQVDGEGEYSVDRFEELFPVTELPFQSFSRFQGTNGNGMWSLNVADTDTANATINSWSLHLNCQ
jgi:subtilisin-like proprotein convertase family protein